MAGGMDILIIGIGDKDNLDDIASDERLNELFNRPPNDSTDEKLWQDRERLAEDPSAKAPLISYIRGEVGLGAANGTALGYLAKKRMPDDVPEQIPAQLLARIEALSNQFRDRMKKLELDIGNRQVGLWMVNIRDT